MWRPLAATADSCSIQAISLAAVSPDLWSTILKPPMDGGCDPLHQLLVTIRIERNRLPEGLVIEPGRPSAQRLGFRLIAWKDMRVKRRVRVAEDLIVDPIGVRGFQQRVAEDGHVAQEEPASLLIEGVEVHGYWVCQDQGIAAKELRVAQNAHPDGMRQMTV